MVWLKEIFILIQQIVMEIPLQIMLQVRYKKNNYDFLVLSDHNHLTILDDDSKNWPLLIPGEEITIREINGSQQHCI